MIKDKKYKEISAEYNHFGREYFYSNFKEFLKHEDGLNIALNGTWGSGKTFLVNKLIDDINSESSGIECLYFNAWRNDYFSTPLYALLNQLLQTNEFKESFETAVLNDHEFKTDSSLSVLIVNLSLKLKSKVEEELSHMHHNSFTVDLIEKAIEMYIKNKHKLIIFIDELDRCRPTFAIDLLEVFNHLSFKNVTFVYSIDYEQLSASIKSVYGSEYNGQRYLYKFFDSIVSLPKIDYNNIFKYLRAVYPHLNNLKFDEEAVANAIDVLDVTFRDMNRFHSYLSRIDILKHYNISSISEKAITTTLIILSIIRMKYPLLVRAALTDFNNFRELGLLFNRLDNYMSYIELEIERFRSQEENFEKIVRRMFDQPEIKDLLY